jgi:hypothetical protein
VKIRKRTTTVGANTATIFEPERANPGLGWAVIDHRYVYATGLGRLQRTLEFQNKGASDLPAKLGGTVAGALASEKNSSVFILRGGAIAETAAALGFGGDPTKKIGIGALIGTATELVRTIGDVAVGVTPEAGGLHLQLREQLQ